MAQPKKEKACASTYPRTDRVAYSKGMCKSCYNKSNLTAEAIAKTNASESAKRLNNTTKTKIEKSAILSVRKTLDI
jgi:hypothetical protein